MPQRPRSIPVILPGGVCRGRGPRKFSGGNRIAGSSEGGSPPPPLFPRGARGHRRPGLSCLVNSNLPREIPGPPSLVGGSPGTLQLPG